MPTIALSGRTEAGLTCPPGSQEIIYWSDQLPGFGLRCRAGGVRSWYVQYRTKAGATRKHTLGSPKDVPFAQAQKEAARLIAAVKLGGDPAGQAKEARAAAKAAITVGELVAAYLKHQKPRMRKRSYEELRRHLGGAKDEGTKTKPRYAKPLDAAPRQ